MWKLLRLSITLLAGTEIDRQLKSVRIQEKRNKHCGKYETSFKHTLGPVYWNSLLMTYRYFVGVVKQHFDGSWTVKLHEHDDTIADGSKQIVLMNQVEYIAVPESARLQHVKISTAAVKKICNECSSSTYKNIHNIHTYNHFNGHSLKIYLG